MTRDIYKAAINEGLHLQSLFFRRFKYMRLKAGEGEQTCMKNMKSLGSTLSHHTLSMYERPSNKFPIKLTTLLIYSNYMQKSLMEMIQPLTEEEEQEYKQLRSRYIKQSEYLTRGRTKKTRA